MPSLASTSATTAHTFVVPMSRPTTISPCEDAELISIRNRTPRKRGPNSSDVRAPSVTDSSQRGAHPRGVRAFRLRHAQCWAISPVMTRNLPSLLAFVSVAAVACGGSSSSIGGGASTDEATTDAANAYCNRAQACAPAYVTLGYGDVATCASRYKQTLVTSFGASGSVETAGQIEACAQAIPNTTCADLLGRNPPSACQTVPGTLADGAPCGSDSQCTGAVCHVPANAVCGTCGEPLAAGGACVSDDDCQYGMSCANAACVTYGAENATCDTAHPCRPDLGCKSGTCTAPSPVGTACQSSDECDNLHGAFCDPTTMQCVNVSFAAPGAACGLVSSQLVACAGPGSLCSGDTAPPYKGACVAFASDGSACDTTNGPLCDVGAVCVPSSPAATAGTCTPPDPGTCK